MLNEQRAAPTSLKEHTYAGGTAMFDISDTLSIPDAARRLGVRRKTIYDWIWRGVRVPGTAARVKLEVVRLGGRYRVRPDAIDRFIEAQNQKVIPEKSKGRW
jgi:excisionase family DNA binding protein